MVLYAYASPVEQNETIDYHKLRRETGATRVCVVPSALMGAITYQQDTREWLWIEHDEYASTMAWGDKMTFRLCSGALEDQPLIAAAEAASEICRCQGPLYVRAENPAVNDSDDEDEEGEDKDEESEESEEDEESDDSGSDDGEDDPGEWAQVMMKLAGQKRGRDDDDDDDEAPVARALLDAVETYGPLAVQGQRRRLMRRLAAASILETLT